MNTQIKIGRSVLVALALTTTGAMAFNTFGTTTTGNGNNHTALHGDLNGTMQISIGANQCPAPITGNIELSKEYLKKYDFNDTVQIFHKVGVNNPSTMNQFTAQMILPTHMNMRASSGGATTVPLTLKLWSVNRTPNVYVSDAGLFNAGVAGLPPHISFGGGNKISGGEVLCLSLVAPTTVPLGSPDSAYATGAPECYNFPIGLTQNTYPTGSVVSGVIELDFYTNSGNPVLRDHSANEFAYKVEPQFEIACDSKLDGLINWENDSKSFVAHKHGQDSTEANVSVTAVATNGVDVQSTVLDRLMFTLNNLGGYTDHLHTVCNTNFDAWLEGNQTEFDVKASNAFDGNWTAPSSLVSSTDATLDTTGIVLLDANTTARFTTADQDILTGDTKFALEFDFSTGYAANALIKAKSFTADLNLEGGEANTSIDVEPYRNTNLANDKLNVGQWMNHAYVAQIAGATENPGTVMSKFFIVNRSCAPAIPTFKLIQDGKIAIIKGNSIPVDSQAKVTMASLLLDPLAVAENFTGKQFAVEIILGGVAEDFYVYAQSLTSGGSTKDLPVYNTSVRD